MTAKVPPPTILGVERSVVGKIPAYWDEAAVLQVVRDALERAAVCAWSTGMNEHNKTAGMPCDAREVGSLCANNIRALLKEYSDD